MGALVRGEADVSVNFLAHCCSRQIKYLPEQHVSHMWKIFSRMDVVDMSDTLYTRPYSIVFRQPELPQDVFAVQVK